ncbi:MAG: ABC transporter permease [Rhizobiaceae bacterium]
MFLETVRLALSSIRRNTLRSFLTLLGIVIGVAAVIAMITIGSGTTAKVQSDISKLGSNLLTIRPGTPATPGSAPIRARDFTVRQVTQLAATLEGAKAISATSQKSVKIVYGTESLTTPVTGTDAGFFIVRDWDVTSGRVFTEQETRGGSPVCVIGETVRKQFFGAGDPLGATIRVGRVNCPVIGLLESKGASNFGTDQDNVVMMPLSAFQRRIAGSNDVETIFVSAEDGVPTTEMQARIETLMREIRKVGTEEDDNFNVRDQTQIANMMSSTMATMTGMLSAVAGVSLLVGGIGIMNIMLVSVTERTREIGIRLAIGAQEHHILTQFVVEATVLALFGGIFGILLGLGLAALASSLFAIPFNPSLSTIALAAGFSALIGLVFGFFPALRGARLDPIEALRHE